MAIEHEVIVIGAGMNGMYQMHRLQQAGIDAIALEANADVGGTWFNNRYPGCRFDVESYSYAFFFSEELIAEWDWAERFSGQPENYRYTRLVAEKTNIRDRIRFNTRVESAAYQADSASWKLVTEDGQEYSCRYLILSVGLLSRKTMPNLEGMETFRGPSFHTLNWPHEGVDLKGKRVAVIGTGSSGVQVIQTIAPDVERLTVFQRRPNWCAPLHNSAIPREEMEEIRAKYADIIEYCHNSPGGLMYEPDRRGYFNVTPAERRELWEKLYAEPGFGILFRNFVEIFMDEEANADLTAFIAEKIRGRVNDPVLAEKLIPKDHGFGIQRIPLEIGYYETYNRDNVELVSLQDEPIVRITPDGIQTEKRHHDFDVIVYATGFFAGMGSYLSMDILGIDGLTLAEKWKHGPRTLMGMMVHGFPNLLMPVGPQSGAASVNYPRAIEMCVNWVTALLEYMRENGKTQLEATSEAEEGWSREARRMADKFLSRKAKNWVNGFNPNEPDAPTQITEAVGYAGGNPKYRHLLNRLAESDYRGIMIS